MRTLAMMFAGLSGAALALASLGAAPARAATLPPSGTLTCALSGSATLKPGLPLTSPGVATKTFKTKIKFTGTLSGCDNSGQVDGKLPIDGGTVKAKGTAIVNPGEDLPSCLGLSDPPTVPTAIKTSVTFTAIGPTKPIKVAKGKALLTLGTPTVGPTISFTVSGTISKGGFLGETAEVSAVLDIGQVGLALACNAEGGLATLSFTGVKGPSTISIHP
jgi:hypothetical protein